MNNNLSESESWWTVSAYPAEQVLFIDLVFILYINGPWILLSLTGLVYFWFFFF